MAPSVPNPNWPTLFAEGNFGANPFFTPSASQTYTDLTPRLYKAWSVRRGKQFELDQVQAAEYHGQWVNKDGFLDPTNTSSPLSPNVLPFRGYRIRAQYPPSINLLNADVATGGESTLVSGSAGTSVGFLSDYAPPTATAVSVPWQGTMVWQLPFGVSVAVNKRIFYVAAPGVGQITGLPFTATMHVRCVSGGANPQVQPIVQWLNAAGSVVHTDTGSAVTLTGSTTAPWTAITLSANAPSSGTAVAAVVALELIGTSPGLSWVFQADGLQWEQNSSASAFTVPGKSYPIYSGLVERYPQDWSYTGTYGLVNLVGVDTMALLSQTILKEAFVMDVVATGPAWFFPLNDPSGSTTFLEQAGRTPPAGLYSSSYGAGTISPGNTIQAATSPSGKFFGTQGPVVTVGNSGLASNAGTVIDLTPAGITGAPSSGGWTRMLAFRTNLTTGGPSMAASTAGYSTGAVGNNSNWYLGLQGTGGGNYSVSVSVYNDAGTNVGLLGSATVNDNNWHLVMFSMSASGKNLTLYVDNVSVATTAGTDMHAANAINDSIGGDEYINAGWIGTGAGGYSGDIALYAQWNFEMSAGTVSNLYTSWRSAWSGDTSDQRYSRILGWAGYQGTQTLDSGTTTTMGYANDISGLDALTALENVVNTEAGRHFVGVDGALNFQSRSRAFQVMTPVYTFGENVGGGEIPYTNLVFDFDPTRLSNQVQITQTQTSQAFWANDATSQSAYGVRNLQRANQSTNNEEVREAPFYYLSRYKDPHLRVQALQVDPASNPALWSQALAFEIGQYVQINRRDQFGVRPTITQFGFIEQVTHTADDQGKWLVDLQISPAPPTPYASFTSLRTTLNTTASSGQPTIVINALPDAATNPVRSQLTGGQILLISGGGNSESWAIDTGGVQNALAGYTTASVTLTNNLINTYPAGSTVVEATGANYDSLAQFDHIQFAY